MYHGITNRDAPECPRRERKYWISGPQFRDQLASIRSEGRRVVLLGELWSSDQVSVREDLPVALTFDDGRSSDYEIAFPFLLEAGLPAEFFVNTANVGKKGFLSWQQMSAMQSAGMSFQSHGHDHVDLARLPPREKERQLKLSKQLLEARLGRDVEFLAVPYGCLSAEVVKVAVDAGYRAVCTSWSWPTQSGGNLVNRVVVYAHTSPNGFKRLLSGNLSSYTIRAARAAMLFFPTVLSRFLHPKESAIGLENVT